MPKLDPTLAGIPPGAGRRHMVHIGIRHPASAPSYQSGGRSSGFVSEGGM
jgi:hypothetical protein